MQTETKQIIAPITLFMITGKEIDQELKGSNNCYFIPEIKTINGFSIPSTPFKDRRSDSIYLGDIVQIDFIDGQDTITEINLVDLIDGQYVTTGKRSDIITPLYLHDQSEITILGSSINNISLLDKLSN